jgi:sterol desaturase/sphingolipid hydroxylase (fatty acid hydroxylase superfamily)
MSWLLQLLSSKGSVVGLTLLVLMVFERIFPLALIRSNLNRLIRNFSFAGINFLLGPLIVIPTTALAAGHSFHWQPVWWSSWTGFALDLLILDCWIYFWHRVNHVVPLLWRFHEVHHLDENLDTSSALRFHFGEVVLSSLVRAAFIILLGMPLSTIVIFETLVTVAAIFHHSNIKLPNRLEKILSLIIVTPSIHWVHHHAKRSDTDANYSTILSIWDRLFGSVALGTRKPDMRIGVEGAKEQKLMHLIMRPFMLKRSDVS